MPVVDIYLLIALAAGLAMGRTTPGVRRHTALIVLILMTANYGMRAVAHHEALALAPRLFGPTLPQRCAPSVPTARIIDRWPRSAPPAWTAPAGHRCLVEIAAIPTFLSPFRWRVLAQMSNAYEIRDMNVLDPRLRAGRTDERGEPVWIVTLLGRSSRPVGTIYIGATHGTVKRTEGMFAGATMEDVENDYDQGEGTGVISDVKRNIKRTFRRTQEEARGMFERVKRSFSDFINRE